MRFWDSSALVPLLVAEKATRRMRALYRSDPEIVTWWGSLVECASALARLEREGNLTRRAASLAWQRLDAAAERWHEAQPVEPLRDQARRLLRVHALRSADSLQLAAALIVAEQQPPTLDFVCLDERLATAADREGFPVLGLDHMRSQARPRAPHDRRTKRKLS